MLNYRGTLYGGPARQVPVWTEQLLIPAGFRLRRLRRVLLASGSVLLLAGCGVATASASPALPADPRRPLEPPPPPDGSQPCPRAKRRVRPHHPVYALDTS